MYGWYTQPELGLLTAAVVNALPGKLWADFPWGHTELSVPCSIILKERRPEAQTSLENSL